MTAAAGLLTRRHIRGVTEYGAGIRNAAADTCGTTDVRDIRCPIEGDMVHQKAAWRSRGVQPIAGVVA